MILLHVLAFLPILAFGVKQEDFKTCSQSSFCRRLRSIGTRQSDAPQTFTSPYSLGEPVVDDSGAASWTWPLRSSLYPEISFQLQVDVLREGDGIVRVRADEVDSTTPWKRYNETSKWVLLEAEPLLSPTATVKLSSAKGTDTITYGNGLSVKIERSPFKLTQLRDGKPEIVLNDRSLFHMEHFRIKQLESQEQDLSEGEQVVLKGGEMDRSWFEEHDKDMFEERFRTWTDSKPKGPEALSIDLTFPGVQHIYGLPEHASPLSLPDTIGDNARYSDPYRLFNVDIFEYLADSPMSLYGAIPLLHAHSKTHSVGVLNLVGSETWVDVVHHNKEGVKTHWMSESGILDLLLLPGPRPQQLFEQYAVLTGPTPLPPQWSTAYHQCRWNYVDEEDVLTVDAKFDEHDIPLDVTWLDVEYATDRRYFEWNSNLFPDVPRMLEAVGNKFRKMVAIIDPHIKRSEDYHIYTEARDLDVLVRNADGSNFEGWCWPGSSAYVDFFNPKSWDWWTRMFSFDVWKDSAPNLHIWNDMNEPSVFNGPEITVPKDTLYHGGWENRDIHNINGMLFHNQTAEAVMHREATPKRPFVLSRAFFAGSHRFSAIWTGDNLGDWEHLAGETAMLLSNNIAGMSFCGADVGGFFGDPTPEILVRWYQAGAFMPFFRAHAHIDTKRREPYLFDEPIRGYLRDAVRLRYQMLPVWYNAFHDASIGGYPIMRPQYSVFPGDEKGFDMDDQYYVGDSGLLFKPVVTEGAASTDVYLADDQPYYDYFSPRLYPRSSSSRSVSIATPLSSFPLLLQGGHIIPIRQRVRRSSPLMWQDPFTLIIALSKEGTASGKLYLDDGEGYDYKNGAYVLRQYDFSGHSLKSTSKSSQAVGDTSVAAYDPTGNAWAKAIAHVKVERIVLLGLKTAPKSVKVGGMLDVDFTFEKGLSSQSKKEGMGSRLVIKNSGVGVVEDWEISIA